MRIVFNEFIKRIPQTEIRLKNSFKILIYDLLNKQFSFTKITSFTVTHMNGKTVQQDFT